ncbi:hypothetical protein RAC89_03405 [Paenibacillus sp. GD4]|uniref:hypothetical protein n=1 Tax=Paenibacillus sp. GD4 TaxID=3068890 RepID=UPI0027966917|nr:hypothetical protein [Paenibacillus sp. GD4]MDQ1909550.1 hypothetical protein [Paenibacillus sp. GD4]
MNHNRVAAVLLAAAVLCASVLPSQTAFGAGLLTLEEAVAKATEQSSELGEARIQMNAKVIELSQAQAAVNHQAEKDFSLFAKPHSLSKDLELKLKVPTARKQLNEAKRELAGKELALRAEIEKLYEGAMQAMEYEALVLRKWNDAKKSAEDAEKLVRFKVKMQEEADKAKEAFAKAESELKLARLALKAAKLQLGEKLGIDPESDFSLGLEPSYAVLTQEQMWRFISHAEKNDFTLYKDTEARKLAEEKVIVTRRLYASKFGQNEMRLIEAMYSSPSMDYELFMANYDILLEDIKRKWEGIFLIPIPFLPIILPIPKVILQGEYDGLRYFDDIRYSLPVSMLEQDKARLKERDTRGKLVNKIKKSFLDAKGAEESYAQALKQADRVREELEAARKKHAVKWITDEELAKSVQASEDADKAAMTGYYAYKSALSALNLASAGAVDAALKPGVLPYQDIDDGLAPMGEPPADPNAAKRLVGSWSVKEAVEGITSELTVKAPKELGATHFALVTWDGKPVGLKVPIDGKVTHISTVFGDMSQLKIELYKDNTVLASVVPEGNGSTGTLTIEASGREE